VPSCFSPAVMPLNTVPDPFELSSYEGINETFVIFYASRDEETGRMWCPDCRDVEDIIARTFGPADGPSGLIIYVGQKAEWKAEGNVFRSAPWLIANIPTIVKLKDKAEVGRLVEGEINGKLAALVEPTSAPPRK